MRPSTLIAAIQKFIPANFTPNYRKLFLSAVSKISWLSISENVSRHSLSAAYIALVNAIECLLLKEGVRCDSCKQINYGSTRKFREFLVEYSQGQDLESIEKLANFYYDQRSKLVHGSNLLQVDLEPWNFMGHLKQQEYADHRNLSQIVRVVFYNWLIRDRQTSS